MCVEIKRARGVSVKQLAYICRRQKVNLNKIDRAIGNQRTRLLCCEEMTFPNDSGYKRFYSPLFSARLCTNMALFALSKFDTPERLTVGIYDPDAQCTDLVSFVLKYTGNACIITDNEDVFYDELNTIAEETGACAVVTHHREQLSNCDLVIAPFEIEENLPVRNDAVILTNGRPKENIKGFVYFRYCFKKCRTDSHFCGLRDCRRNTSAQHSIHSVHSTNSVQLFPICAVMIQRRRL